jgi:hypothetical protein
MSLYRALIPSVVILAASTLGRPCTYAADKTFPGTGVALTPYRIMDDRNPKKMMENSKLIDIFRPELDLVAFTSYPADHFSSPDDIPSDYARIYDHVGRGDEVMFMEIGWPTNGKGTESERSSSSSGCPA